MTNGHEVSIGVSLFFAMLLVAMILCLAFEEKLHAKKSVIVGSFAVALLLLGGLFGLLPFSEMDLHVGDADIHLPVYIPAIDWGVIAIILGSSLFVDVTAKSGLFTWIAIRLTKASKGDPLVLLAAYGSMTVIFSAVLNNVTAMIIVGSLTSVSLRRLGISSKLLGFLLIEGLLTNVGGLLTLISSVPNIIVGNAAGISFATFFLKAAPYVVSPRPSRSPWGRDYSTSADSRVQRSRPMPCGWWPASTKTTASTRASASGSAASHSWPSSSSSQAPPSRIPF